MVKKILATLISFCVATAINAQLDFGLKSGLNISDTKNLLAHTLERYSWNAGMFIHLKLTKSFFIQPELLYSSKGHRFDPLYDQTKGANRLHYLAVPVLLGYQVDQKLSIVLGPEFNYLIKSAVRFDRNVSDFTKQYPRFDAGIDLGVNYKLNKKLAAELRYNYGLNTLFYTDFAGVKHDEIKGGNRVFQAGITYLLTK